MRGVTRVRRSTIAVAAILAVTASLPASGVDRAQEPRRPTFASEVELITVDAVVVDGKGQPVTGLTRDDFVVEEDGKPQPVVSFESISVPAETEAAPEAKEQPAVVTNATGQSKPRRTFALLADDLQLPREQSPYLRRAMARFIDSSLSPGDTVLLGTTSDEAWWGARIPQGREDLHHVLDRLKARYVDPSTSDHMTEYEALAITMHAPEHPPAGGPSSISSASGVFERVVLRVWDLGLCGHKDPDLIDPCWPYVKNSAATIEAARRQRVGRVIAAMGRALSALPTGPGRTSLILFSRGFINDDLGREVATMAVRAHAAVYFVDVRGLETGIVSATEQKDARANENPGDATQKQFEKLNLESGGAEALAEETGGFSVRNTNDLAAAGERIAAESRTFYLLGIAPPPGKRRDEWRKLHVTVRRAGLTVRARRGYSVEAAGTGASARVPIPLRLASYVLQPTDQVTLVMAVAEIDTTGLAGDLQMRLEATPRDGDNKTQVQDLSLQAAANGGWRPARVELALPAGVYRLRVFLREPSTGRTGTVEQRVVVPDPATFRLSTPVLSDTVAARVADGPVAALPIAHDELKSTAERPLLVSFEVFGAAPEAGTGRQWITTAFDLKDRYGSLVAAAPAAVLDPAPDGRWQQMIALPALPNGDYDLTITAQDRVAGREQVERRSFKVVGGPEPPPSPPVDAELASLLDRAAHYASSYQNDFSNVIAEEDCHQVVHVPLPAPRPQRFTKATAFFVTVPSALPWATFRDVWEVDGARIRNRGPRLAQLFQGSPAADAVTRARAILDESNRYNLGPHRTVNAPTLALLFLLPQNQSRFDFEIKGHERLEGTMTTIVAFRERGRPTLVAGNSPEGCPAEGRMWIDPERGVVVKTDVLYNASPPEHNSRARIVTDYRPEPRLHLWVPGKMTESYSWPLGEPSEATTVYSEYSRAGVVTEESYEAPKDAPPPATKP
jgi:VWFA-related protein